MYGGHGWPRHSAASRGYFRCPSGQWLATAVIAKKRGFVCVFVCVCFCCIQSYVGKTLYFVYIYLSNFLALMGRCDELLFVS